MLELDIIVSYTFVGAWCLAVILGVIYGLMWYVRLIIDTVKKWRAEDATG
jgi:hypothetical protein